MTEPSGPQISMRGAVDLSGLGRPQVAEPGTPGGAPAAGGYVIDVTMDTFQAVIEASRTYLVLALLWLPKDQTCAQLAADLGSLATEANGAFQLARIDIEAEPQIAAAFQAQGVPMVIAIVAGQPVPLFEGASDLEQVRPVIAQVLEAAQQNGVTGRAPSIGEAPDEQEAAPIEPPLPLAHQEAYVAIEAGDFAAAEAAYRKALREDPRDHLAVAGLAQVTLLARMEKADPSQVRQAAADAPDDLDAQLAVADLDLLGGKVDDALGRLIHLIPAVSGDEREKVRLRLIDYFAVLGPEDPRVGPARRNMANALY